MVKSVQLGINCNLIPSTLGGRSTPQLKLKFDEGESVENNKLQAIRTQAVEVWKQLQLGQMPGLMPSDRGHTDGGKIAKIKVAEGQGLDTVDRDELFSDTTVPISKLNLPKVNVDPWSAFWILFATITGGTGLTSYLLLTSVPPTANCQSINPIFSTDSERLYCAQVGAKTRELPKILAAINLVKDWSVDHPLHSESQRLLAIWSQSLTRIAREQLDRGKMEQAVATLKVIPPSSPTYQQTQELIGRWSDQSDIGKEIETKFDLALQEGDWGQAFAQLQSLQRMRGQYWNTYKHEQLSFKLAQEEDGWDKLQEALDALEGRESNGYFVGARRSAIHFTDRHGKKEVEKPLPTTPEPLVRAMELANQINPTTHVYQRGQTLRTTWSKQLLNLAIAQYKEQNFNAAMSIARTVPQDVPIYREAQDWVKLNQAHIAAGKRHLLALMDAIAQIQRIDRHSSLHALGQLKKTHWQGQLKQQTQLQWAKAIGNFGHPSTLSIAIATAKQIPSTSTEASEAQTEIADWNRQIQTVDHRLTLAKAKQLISAGETLANLKAAVKLASKIAPDQPLGAEATQEVAQWTTKIQTIEDQPILDRAQTLANRGDLSEAIQLANQIAPGRALYGKAQGNVRYWWIELQEIADRNTLYHAKSLYRRGQISAAIAAVSQIGRRSPVYGEARSYLSDWQELLTPKNTYSFKRDVPGSRSASLRDR